MPKLLDQIGEKKSTDLMVLRDFVLIFCREKHKARNDNDFFLKDVELGNILGQWNTMLCRDCYKLLGHGIAKLHLCPYDPKPMCKKCPTHCYAPGYRQRIREVMRFSSMHVIKRGRLDLFFHYLF